MQTPVRYLQLPLFLLIVIAMALASPARALQPTATFVDDFDSGVDPARYVVPRTPPELWTVDTDGPTVRITKPAGGSPPSWITAGIGSRFRLDGDFTITVDFKLNDFPVPTTGYNGSALNVQMRNTASMFQVVRHGNGHAQRQEIWVSCIRGGQWAYPLIAPSSLVAGQFRLQRAGNTMSASVRGNPADPFTLLWSETHADYTGLTEVILYANQGNGAISSLDVEFDNLVIEAEYIYFHWVFLPLVLRQAAAAPPVGPIPVGNGPWGIGLDATANRIYVANQESDTVSVIDGATHGVISTIGVGNGPAGVGVNSVTQRIYVANYLSNNVSIIDGATNTVVATVPVGSDPNGVAVNPNTNRIYVANYLSNNVSVINGATNTVVTTVAVGSRPYFVGVNAATNRIYVGNSNGNTVSVIDGATHNVIATIAVGSGPYGIGVNPITNRIYVANANSDTVSVIDGATNTVINTVAVGDKPYAIDVRTANNRYYVTNENHNTLWVMDGATNAAVSVLPTGSEPDGVAVHPSSGFIYVSNYSSDTVSALLDPNP